MSIIINETNRTKILKLLEAGQEKARVRTIDIDDVYFVAETLEKHRQSAGIAKKHCESTTATFTRVEYIASRYKGVPMSSFLRLEYKNSSWRFIEVYRSYTAQSGNNYSIQYSEEAKADIIKAMENYDC